MKTFLRPLLLLSASFWWITARKQRDDGNRRLPMWRQTAKKCL